ncbi:MAG: DUF7467 domain-containing protein, partial [Gammaproteobacteria bacterium]
TLTLVKTVINDNGGTLEASDFQAYIDAGAVPWGSAQTVTAGSHTASEDEQPGYIASTWGGDCAADGTVTLNLGENKTCTITNHDLLPVCPPGGGKPKQLVVKLVDDGDPFGNSQTPGGDVFVIGGPLLDDDPVDVTGVSGVPGNPLTIIGGTGVHFGDIFVLTGSNSNKGTPPKVDLTLMETTGDQETMRVGFHTSCSQPLAVGDQFGPLLIIGDWGTGVFTP